MSCSGQLKKTKKAKVVVIPCLQLRSPSPSVANKNAALSNREAIVSKIRESYIALSIYQYIVSKIRERKVPHWPQYNILSTCQHISDPVLSKIIKTGENPAYILSCPICSV